MRVYPSYCGIIWGSDSDESDSDSFPLKQGVKKNVNGGYCRKAVITQNAKIVVRSHYRHLPTKSFLSTIYNEALNRSPDSLLCSFSRKRQWTGPIEFSFCVLSRECCFMSCLPKPLFADMVCRVGDMSATWRHCMSARVSKTKQHVGFCRHLPTCRCMSACCLSSNTKNVW